METRHKRSLGVLAAALTMSSAGALAGEITLFQDPGFAGDSVTLQSPMRDLQRNGFANASSAVVRSGTWLVCTGADFSGTCAEFQPGEYSNASTLLHDDIASAGEIADASTAPTGNLVSAPPATGIVSPAPVIVARPSVAPAPVIVAAPSINTSPAVASGAPMITFFERPGFGGNSFELHKTMGGLDRAAQYAGANAAIVYNGVWRLCTREYFRGTCADFGPGRYDNLGPLTGQVNSAELVSVTGTAPVSMAPPPVSGRLVMYERPHFGGQAVIVDGSAIADLNRAGLSGRAESLVIESGRWMICTHPDFRGTCYTMDAGQYAALPSGMDHRIGSAGPVHEVYGSL